LISSRISIPDNFVSESVNYREEIKIIGSLVPVGIEIEPITMISFSDEL